MSAAAVVSWPATIKVRTSSIISLSLIAVWLSRSRAAISMLKKSNCSLGLAPPPFDQLADQLGERAEAECEFQIAILFLGDDFERIGAQLPLETLQISAENRVQHDLQREFADIVGEVDRLAARRLRGPALGEFLVDLVDQLAEAIDDAPMKAGLHHAALAPPEIALAGHDAVAEQDLDPIHALALGVIAMIRQQHLLDVVGMIDDVVVHAAARSENAVDVAEAREILAQPRQ